MKFKGWWLVVLMLLPYPVYAEVADRIVAVVNEEIIILSEFNTAFEPYRRRIEEAYRGAEREKVLIESRRAFLNKLIDGSLIEQEAKKNNISVKDEEVAAALQDFLNRKKLTLDELARDLAKEGVSLESYKRDIREQLIRMRLLRRQLQSKIMVTAEEIGEYYGQHRSEYEGKEGVRVKQIFLAFPRGADEAARETVRKNAALIVRRLKDGEPFDALAAQYSQGPTAGGGDLGFIERGMVRPEVEKVAFDLKKDEIGGPVESAAGFHILQVVDRRGAGLKPIGEVREEIQARIEEQKMSKKFDEWMEALRKRAHIEVKL